MGIQNSSLYDSQHKIWKKKHKLKKTKTHFINLIKVTLYTSFFKVFDTSNMKNGLTSQTKTSIR